MKITKKKFAKAAENTGGILNQIARRLSCSRQYLYEWLSKNPDQRVILEQEREKIIDAAETNLFKQATEGSKWATNFILKTVGKDRGYTERQEVQHSGETKQTITYDDLKDALQED